MHLYLVFMMPEIFLHNAQLYNLWKDAQNPRGLWRRTTLESFRTKQPDWEAVLDLDSLAAEEGEDWIWRGSATLPGRHDRAILHLSRGGGDAVAPGGHDFVIAVTVRADPH